MDDDVLQVNLNDLKVREIEELEEIIGGPFDQAFASDKPRGRTLRALGYIIKRRENPAFTLEQAGELRILFNADEDPTPAAG